MQKNIIFQMWPFVSLFQCQVGLVFSLMIALGEPLPDLLPHHVAPSTL
jgi:hypothetical protein